MENPQARVVEGSNGLLLEIDGAIVPNYEATFRTIEEGEVVTGNVVPSVKDIRHPALVGQLIGAAVLPLALTLK